MVFLKFQKKYFKKTKKEKKWFSKKKRKKKRGRAESTELVVLRDPQAPGFESEMVGIWVLDDINCLDKCIVLEILKLNGGGEMESRAFLNKI